MRVDILKKKKKFFLYRLTVTLPVSLSPHLIPRPVQLHTLILLLLLRLAFSHDLFLPMVLIESDKQGILYLLDGKD